MFYYIYQISNNLNGKIYVGVHQTTNLNDGYMGSGKVIRRALEKHGVDNFTKVILETFENAEAMYAREKEVVDEEFLSRSDVYNVLRGGHGGFNYLNDSSEEHKQRAKRGYESAKKSGLLSFSDERRQKIAEMSKLRHKNNPHGFCNEDEFMRRSQNKLQKTPLQIKGHQQGKTNSQFGTCWITHELVGSKKCNKELLPLYIEQGWHKGRK